MFVNNSITANGVFSAQHFDFVYTQVIAAIGISGNLLVLKTIYGNTTLRSNTYTFIANQSIGMLIYSLSLLLPMVTCIDNYVHSNFFERYLCDSTYMLHVMGLSCSKWTVSAIAFERFYKLYFPLKGNLNRIKQIALIWLLALTESIVILTGKELTTFFADTNFYGCFIGLKTFENYFSIIKYLRKINFFALEIFPFLITGLLYTFVIIKAYERKANNNQESRSQHLEIQFNEITRLCLAITLWFYSLHWPLNLLAYVYDDRNSFCKGNPEVVVLARIIYLLAQLMMISDLFVLGCYGKIFTSRLTCC